MHLLTSRWLTVTLLLALAIAIWTLINTGRVRGQEQPGITSTTALLTTNRTSLKICVQSLVPGVDSRIIQGQIKGAMTSVSNHPDFQRAGLGREPVVVDAGCPSAPTITNPRYTSKDMSGVPAVVTTPSQYRLFVFVVSSDQLTRAFTWRPHLTPQEMMCAGDACNEVTTAAYLTPTELLDRTALERSLTQGVGLWPVGRPQTNPAFDPAGAVTPGSR